MNGFSAKWYTARSAFQAALREAGEVMSKRAETLLAERADKWLLNKEEDPDLPFKTGNLISSIGISIANNGRIVHAMPMPDETGGVTQTYKGRKVWGPEEIMEMFRSTGARQYRGVVANLFVAVPYAQMVDEGTRHKGYLERMQTQYEDYMRKGIERLAKMGYKTR